MTLAWNANLIICPRIWEPGSHLSPGTVSSCALPLPRDRWGRRRARIVPTAPRTTRDWFECPQRITCALGASPAGPAEARTTPTCPPSTSVSVHVQTNTHMNIHTQILTHNATHTVHTHEKGCLPGRFANSSNAVACEACGTGTFQPESGQSGCRACAAGGYCAGDAGQTDMKWTPCPVGTFSNTTGLGSISGCEACPPGHVAQVSYNVDDGTVECQACDAGRHASRDGGSCELCEPGRWSGATATRCLDCSAGTVSSVGAELCEECEPGRYANAQASACLSCGAGRSRTGNGTDCER